MKVDAVDGVDLTEETVSQMQDALQKNGVDIKLNVDLAPKFVVGHVTKKEKHPNADKLSICTVDVGSETVQIVCGAPNVDAGQKVVVAKVGAVMPSGMVIRDAELRGVASAGMICSAKELALPDAPEEKGILVLDGDAVVRHSIYKVRRKNVPFWYVSIVQALGRQILGSEAIRLCYKDRHRYYRM